MTKRSRRLVLLATVAGFGMLAVLAGAGWLLQPNPRITRATIDQIRPGMTVQEVESLLNVPAGYTASGRSTAMFTIPEPAPPWMQAAVRNEWWVGDDAAVLVFFDANDRVLHAAPCDVSAVPPTFWSVLRRSLRV